MNFVRRPLESSRILLNSLSSSVVCCCESNGVGEAPRDVARDPCREPGREPLCEPFREVAFDPYSVVIWYDELCLRSIVTSTAAPFSLRSNALDDDLKR